jgi:hypothetical protein
MWRIWWVPNNASKWQMGFNSAFNGLKLFTYERITLYCHAQLYSSPTPHSYAKFHLEPSSLLANLCLSLYKMLYCTVPILVTGRVIQPVASCLQEKTWTPDIRSGCPVNKGMTRSNKYVYKLFQFSPLLGLSVFALIMSEDHQRPRRSYFSSLSHIIDIRNWNLGSDFLCNFFFRDVTLCDVVETGQLYCETWSTLLENIPSSFLNKDQKFPPKRR